ncbi:hypothetical protein Tco_1333299 [Tanacetum coccineum]
MHDDETPDAYLDHAQEYVDTLAAISEHVKNKDLVMLVVSGLITNHGHNESDCTIEERKMDCKFFSRLIKDHLSLEPQGIHLELPLREVFFLDQKGSVLMMISVTRRRNDTMQMSAQPILCFKDYPKTSTSSSITTLKQKQFGTMSKCFLQVLNSPKKIENLSCMMNLSGSRCFQLNSKFVNNMSLEWDRFVTVVKLNKGLKETNHEQLYAYLKQHEKHAAQNRLIIKRITPTTNDQLAFVSTVQPYAQSSHVQSHQYPSSSAAPQSPHIQSLQHL